MVTTKWVVEAPKGITVLVPHGSGGHEIAYPPVASEFEVQAFLYAGLRALGIDVRGEVQVHGLFGLRSAKAACRFDLVLFREEKPVLILEVKARRVSHKNGVEATRQGKRYTQFGVPTWMVYGIDEARQVLEAIKANS